ncbi:mandelate racemase/muconate lactonizing enzyme family protein [Actinopolymorpha singaporensis]|uniref:L-alanine-DL-glutamate epimerase n=1 Tax=Actinopolymorpha singaporensis TaxID=117157 RepID=A0A1H1W7M4_9ACTN|nr:enolase C-terminal domain-like protein [Actinopolymorpha singaporensis]SDS93187.1 L-alanine-DL-glutamate epimerase [Actinopolymorpha singaporensis]
MSPLGEHRVSEIRIVRPCDRYPRTIGRNARLGSHGNGGPVTAVCLATDGGAQGWGVALGDQAGLEAAARSLPGRAVADVFDPAVGVTDRAALPLDLALHDLAGQLLGLPVYEMLGAAGPRPVPCYDAAIYFDDLDPDDAPRGVGAVLANCRADEQSGHRAFKLKIGRGHRWMAPGDGLRRDIEVTRAVREQHPAARILVDANDGYSPDSFFAYLEAVADCGLYWIEEPFPENHADLTRLRAELTRLGSTALVADGEYEPDVPLLLDLAADGLVDVLLMDVVSFGFTAWRRLWPRVRSLGVQLSPHAWGQPLKTRYAAHLAAGLGGVPIVEGVPGETEGVDASNYRLADGALHLPDTPGFGMPLPPTPDVEGASR